MNQAHTTDDTSLTIGDIQAAMSAYQDHIPFAIRLLNGNLLTHGTITFDPNVGIVVSPLPSPQDATCPFCNTPTDQHLPPLAGTTTKRCPICCHSLFRIRSAQGYYWSNRIEGWVQDRLQATIFASTNDPAIPNHGPEASTFREPMGELEFPPWLLEPVERE